MNHESLIRRINKAIDAASAKSHASSIHMLTFDKDTSKLSGLVIVLSESCNIAELNPELYHQEKSQPHSATLSEIVGHGEGDTEKVA